MLFNPLSKRENSGIPDLNAREIGLLAPLVVLIIVLGFYPKPVLDRMQPAAERVIELAKASRLAPQYGPVAPVAAASDNR
jgi:NADH-quinone oxidoreductase subunit M